MKFLMVGGITTGVEVMAISNGTTKIINPGINRK